MIDIPRYSDTRYRGIQPDDDGDLAYWADVFPYLQQLEQEKARLEVSVDDLRSALDRESELRRDAEIALDEANERACE